MKSNKENKEFNFKNFVAKKTEGREKSFVYGMGILMILMFIFILVDRQKVKNENIIFDPSEHIKEVSSKVDKDINEVKKIFNTSELVDEYEKLLNENSMDTTRIKELELLISNALKDE